MLKKGEVKMIHKMIKEGLSKSAIARKFELSRDTVSVIDEIGYFPMSKEDAHHFFQVIFRRYERGSTIVISNLVFSQWSSIFANDKIVTTAILDRLLHHSHVIHILGDSYRLKEKKMVLKYSK